MHERKLRSEAHLALCASIAIVLLLPLSTTPVRAQGRGPRTLRNLVIDETPNGWNLELQLDVAVRYLRHTPTGLGDSLRIRVDPLGIGALDLGAGLIREVLALPGNRKIPLVEVSYSRSASEGNVIELQFSRRFSFRVEQGGDLRSLRIEVDRRASTPEATTPPTPATTVDGGKSDLLLTRAKHAIRDGEPDLAISLLTKILETDPSKTRESTRQQAQELLGLTHERRGQTAHARAEYEAYLAAYPDGPEADRVRQRLDALLTAGSAPRDALRASSKPRPSDGEADMGRRIEADVFGSLAVTYFRGDTFLDQTGGNFLASNVLTDIDLAGRVDGDDWVVRSDFIGTYDADMADEGRSDDLRVSQMSVEFEERNRGIEIIVGRQGRSDSGVLGRFDGVYGSYRLGTHYSISALVGMPVQSFSDSSPNTDSIIAGGAIDVDDLWLQGLHAQLFVIGQNTESMQDRTAIGGELRYASSRAYSFVYIDYDALFDSLNTVIASSTYYWTPTTDLRILVERRNSPIVTLESALQGRTQNDLDELNETFSSSEIRDLALDRVLTFWTGTAGATHRPNDRYQISLDFNVSYSSDTNDSADGLVPGVDASGPNFGASTQFQVNDWLIENGVGSVALRYFEGDASRTFGVAGFSRFLLPGDVRMIPRLRWDLRDSDLQGTQSALTPSLELDWRIRAFLFNANGGVQWLEPVSGSTIERETSYFIEVGIRWEF